MAAEWFTQALLQDQIDARTSYLASAHSTPSQAKAIVSALRDVWPDGLNDLEVLKLARQRRVLRLDAGGTSVILKLFPLGSPISRLRHKKYARREFLNYHAAVARGIQTPLCHGFVEQRSMGLVTCSGLVIEDLGRAQDASTLAKDSSYVSASLQGVPALVSLFNAGVNHIDARDENILFTPDGWRIIDWQYARFVGSKAAWLLEHLAAYYIVKAPPKEQGALQDTWLSALFDQAETQSDIKEFRSRVARLLERHQGTRARLALRPA